MERALLAAIPNKDKVRGLRKQLETLRKEYEDNESGIQRIIKSIADGIITQNEAKHRMEELRERKSNIQIEIERCRLKLEDIPTAKQIKKRSRDFEKKFIQFKEAMIREAHKFPFNLDSMKWADKRGPIQSAFDGKDKLGRRLGVYIMQREGRQYFEALGDFEKAAEGVPRLKGLLSVGVTGGFGKVKKHFLWLKRDGTKYWASMTKSPGI